MGEKIKVIENINIKDLSFDIELNEGTVNAKRPLYIHLQNQRFRLAIPDYAYLQIAIAIHTAKRKLKKRSVYTKKRETI